jgi:hypothetical protein
VAQQPNSGLGPLTAEVSLSHTHAHTRTHTHTPGRTPLNEWSARLRARYLHNKHNRRVATPSTKFEPAIPTNKRPQTYAWDCAAAGLAVARFTEHGIEANALYCKSYWKVLTSQASPVLFPNIPRCPLSNIPKRLTLAKLTTTRITVEYGFTGRGQYKDRWGRESATGGNVMLQPWCCFCGLSTIQLLQIKALQYIGADRSKHTLISAFPVPSPQTLDACYRNPAC